MTVTRPHSSADGAAAAVDRPGFGVRFVTLVLASGTLVYALGVIVFGLIGLLTRVAAGVVQPTMYWRSMTFTDDGDGMHHVRIAGAGGGVLTSVTGASAGTTAVYVVATLLGMSTQAGLAIVAWRLLRRLREGRPFDTSAWREIAVIAVVLLTCGVAAQVLDWLTQVAVIADAGGSSTMVATFAFEPLTVSAGLALGLVAVAFRVGERLQHDVAGLV